MIKNHRRTNSNILSKTNTKWLWNQFCSWQIARKEIGLLLLTLCRCQWLFACDSSRYAKKSRIRTYPLYIRTYLFIYAHSLLFLHISYKKAKTCKICTPPGPGFAGRPGPMHIAHIYAWVLILYDFAYFCIFGIFMHILHILHILHIYAYLCATSGAPWAVRHEHPPPGMILHIFAYMIYLCIFVHIYLHILHILYIFAYSALHTK